MENARHTMLLVDDTEINLDILEGIFEADFIILKALNGKQALKVLKSQKVDIVILDVVMPEMDGLWGTGGNEGRSCACGHPGDHSDSGRRRE